MAAGDGTPFEEIERLVQQQAVVPRARLADEGTPVPELTQELVLDD